MTCVWPHRLFGFPPPTLVAVERQRLLPLSRGSPGACGEKLENLVSWSRKRMTRSDTGQLLEIRNRNLGC